MTTYFPASEALLRRVPSFDRTRPQSSDAPDPAAKLFKTLVSQTIMMVGIDEEEYLEQYKDVAEVVRTGALKSGTQHYALHGYFERRLALPATFDYEWYLERYADVSLDMEDDERKTGAIEHFLNSGWQEWRAPSKSSEQDMMMWREILA